MEKTGADAVHPIQLADAEEHKPEVDSLELSLRRLEDRASARTEVLKEMLERQRYERPAWPHWGINE